MFDNPTGEPSSVSSAVIAEPHGGNTAGIDNPTHLRISRRPQNVAGTIYIRLIKLLAVNSPQAIVGGDVKYHLATLHSTLQRFEVAQIAEHAFRRQIGNVVRPAASPYQKAQVCAVSEQLARDMASQETSRTCDETLHSAPTGRPPCDLSQGPHAQHMHQGKRDGTSNSAD